MSILLRHHIFQVHRAVLALPLRLLSGNYIFEPFGVETLGPWGPSAHSLFKDLSKRLVDTSRDPRAGFYLGQRLSVAIQRGNAASLLGTLPADSVGEEFFDAV